MSSKEVFALRRQGQHEQAKQMAAVLYQQDSGDEWNSRAYGWCLYDEAKALVQQRKNNAIAAQTFSTMFSAVLRELLTVVRYLPREDFLPHILRLAGQARKEWQDFLKFANYVGLDDFSADDKKPKTNEQGQSFASGYQSYLYGIGKHSVEALKAEDEPSRALGKWGLQVLTAAADEYPDDIWIPYYIAKMLLAQQDAAKAISYLFKVIKRKPREPWVWTSLGAAIAEQSEEDAQLCYMHAINLARTPQSVASVLPTTALHLSAQERFAEAASLIKAALDYREESGYPVTGQLASLQRSDWYKNALASNDFKKLPDVTSQANSLLNRYDPRPMSYVLGVLEQHNEAKHLAWVRTGLDAGTALHYKDFPDIQAQPVGSLLELGSKNAQRVIDWRPAAAELAQPAFYVYGSGQIEKRPDKSFAFVKVGDISAFVPPFLAQNFAEGRTQVEQVTAIRSKRPDGQIGWRVICLQKSDDSS